MSGSAPIEVEIKLALPTPEDHARLCRALGEPFALVEQTNLFLDGLAGELTRARVALRVREEKTPDQSRRFLSLKAGGAVSGVVHQRAEYEAPLPPSLDGVERDPSALLASGLEPIRVLTRLIPGLSHLVTLGRFHNQRRKYRVSLLPRIDGEKGNGPHAEETVWEVDRTTFSNGTVDHELEVEIGHLDAQGSGAEAWVAAVRSRLDELGVAHRAQPLTKYARFLQALGNRPEAA